MNLLSIDPGGTTGIAYRLMIGGADPYLPASKSQIFTLTHATGEAVWALAAGRPLFTEIARWDQVICEKFTGAGHMNRVRVDVIELVGGIRALCWKLGIPFTYRTPQNRRAYQDMAHVWLKEQGVPFVDHQEDALAHLFAWEIKVEREAGV